MRTVDWGIVVKPEDWRWALAEATCEDIAKLSRSSSHGPAESQAT